MNSNTEYLFAYGTLQQPTTNYYAALVHQNCEIIGRGYFYGTLKDFGDYPGAQIDPDKTQRVYGTLFKFLKNKEKTLQELDHYEGYIAEKPVASLFLRKEIEIYHQKESFLAITYLYKGH